MSKRLIKLLEKAYDENRADFINNVMERAELEESWYETDTEEKAGRTLEDIEYEWEFENTIRESAYLRGIADCINIIKFD